jgi:hypothetical protein
VNRYVDKASDDVHNTNKTRLESGLVRNLSAHSCDLPRKPIETPVDRSKSSREALGCESVDPRFDETLKFGSVRIHITHSKRG